ncbi:MAG: hypothetical protein II622_08195, partial [Thermoguttaceae bacterium]|nr:hypothetical protein [Thermoguttaceae bacterium]
GGSSFIQLPVWMGIPVADGSRIFLAKAGLELKISDLSVLSISVFMDVYRRLRSYRDRSGRPRIGYLREKRSERRRF